MQKKILLFLLLASGKIISAQLTITTGASLNLQGNAQLTLQDIDLVNNGNFVTGTGAVSFTGTASSSISGSQPLQFYTLEINKSSGSVTLQRMISIGQSVTFTSGNLNLNSFDLDLGTTGILSAERESSRIVGTNGGRVLIAANLNAPTAANPGNLGAIITSLRNLGTVTIIRGHQSQHNSNGNGNSILRYFDISPTNNSSLNATLRFQYFDGELNGLDENGLVLWKSANTSSWTNEGFSSRNTAGNYVEKTGIASFSRWTLSSVSNPLPVQFVLFNIKCEDNRMMVNWKTAQEENTGHFDVQSSSDGIHWNAAATVAAAGNSNIAREHSVTLNNSFQSAYYRIAAYDAGGQVSYTSILRSSCAAKELFAVWPNPFNNVVFVNVVVNNESDLVIRLFDSKGALVRSEKTTVLKGSNQISMDLKELPAGVYQLSAEWDKGETKKTVQVIRQ